MFSQPQYHCHSPAEVAKPATRASNSLLLQACAPNLPRVSAATAPISRAEILQSRAAALSLTPSLPGEETGSEIPRVVFLRREAHNLAPARLATIHYMAAMDLWGCCRRTGPSADVGGSPSHRQPHPRQNGDLSCPCPMPAPSSVCSKQPCDS
jgi:hypothetical protein